MKESASNHPIGEHIKNLPQNERYAAVVALYQDICLRQDLLNKDTFTIFSSGILDSLLEYERQYLADLMVTGMQEPHRLSCESHMWGLSRIVPKLHNLYQRGYAESILLAADRFNIRECALETLVDLIRSLKIEERADMSYFFSGMLKGNASTPLKITLVKLVQRVMDCVPEAEGLVLADCVIPLIYNSDRELVRHALNYFNTCFDLLAAQHRFSYARMLGSLVTDVTFGPDVLPILSRIIAKLPNEMERERISALIEAHSSQPEQIASNKALKLSSR